RDRPGELGVDRERVAREHRHTHARPGHGELGDVEDLAALVAELLLLVGLGRAVVDDRAGHRDDVERDRPHVHARLGQRAGAPGRTAAPGSGTATAPPSCARPARSPSAAARTWPSSSATPATPLPDTAWYVDTTRRDRPASSCSGLRTGIAAIVVQFGLAMMP